MNLIKEPDDVTGMPESIRTWADGCKRGGRQLPERKDRMKKKPHSSCELCANYVYDEDYEAYVCDVNLDEDEICLLYTSP